MQNLSKKTDEKLRSLTGNNHTKENVVLYSLAQNDQVETEPELLKQIRNIVQETLRTSNSNEGLPQLYNLHELSSALKVSKRTLEYLISDGKLTPIWIRGQRRFSTACIHEYLRTCEKQKSPKKSHPSKS